MTDTNSMPETQDTAVLPQAEAPAQAAAPSPVPPVSAAAATAPEESKPRPNYRTYVVATVAAVVFGVMLSAVSFAAGTFVGRTGMRGPVAGLPAQGQMQPPDGSGFGGSQDYGRGRGQQGLGTAPGAEQDGSTSGTGRQFRHPRGQGFGGMPDAGQVPQDAPTQ